MAEVVWSRGALASLNRATAYIKQFSPSAARRMTLRLRAAGDSLAEHPDRGRLASGGRRELSIVPPYVISYRVAGDKVQILRVRHGRQRS